MNNTVKNAYKSIHRATRFSARHIIRPGDCIRHRCAAKKDIIQESGLSIDEMNYLDFCVAESLATSYGEMRAAAKQARNSH